jgi:hypothetical protein
MPTVNDALVFFLRYGPDISARQVFTVVIGVVLLIIFVGAFRQSRRQREIRPGVFVVGSRSKESDTGIGWANDGDGSAWHDPYKIGAFNPYNGRINDGTPQDYELLSTSSMHGSN